MITTTFNMNSRINQVTSGEIEKLNLIIPEIVKVADPLRIICYGVRSTSKQMWSCFLSETETMATVAYDFLVIIKDVGTEKLNELQDKIHRLLSNQEIYPTIVFHTLTAVKEALQNESGFFIDVFNRGEIVYESDVIWVLPPFSVKTPTEESVARKKINWSRSFALAQRFYDGGCDCAFVCRNDVAIFLFHQATEITSAAIIRLFTGYRPTTHNLKRLFSMIDNFTDTARLLFPSTTKEEGHLFNLLCKAYSDVRYKEEYSIETESVFILMQRVKEFLALAEILYQNKIREITKDLTK